MDLSNLEFWSVLSFPKTTRWRKKSFRKQSSSFSQTAGRQRTTQAVQVEQGLRAGGSTSMMFSNHSLTKMVKWVRLKIGLIPQTMCLTGKPW